MDGLCHVNDKTDDIEEIGIDESQMQDNRDASDVSSQVDCVTNTPYLRSNKPSHSVITAWLTQNFLIIFIFPLIMFTWTMCYYSLVTTTSVYNIVIVLTESCRHQIPIIIHD